MAEDVKNTESIDETVTDTVETPDNKNNSKTFNQDEVNKLVQSRVRKEQEKMTGAKSEWESREAEYTETISKYEEVLQKMVEAQSKDLPDNMRKLLAKLPIMEQLEFLSDESNFQTSKKVIPTTPQAQTQTQEKPRKSVGTFF